MRCPAAPAVFVLVGALGASAADTPPAQRPAGTPPAASSQAAIPGPAKSYGPLPGTSKKPDLRFELVAQPPAASHVYQLKIVNAGGAGTGKQVKVVFTCEAAPSNDALQPVPAPCSTFQPPLFFLAPLGAGESKVLRTFKFEKTYFKKLKAGADPDNVIEETDETNNVLDLLAGP